MRMLVGSIKSLILLLVFFWIFLFGIPFYCLAVDPPKVSFEKALKESKVGDLSSALSLWNQFLESYPNNSPAWSNRGNVRLALGDINGAIADQTKSIELTPLEIDPYLNRAIAKEALHSFEDAETDYLLVLQRDSHNPFALFNLANLKAAQGDWFIAARLYKQASMFKPGFVMALSSKALSDYQIGELVIVEKELRDLIRKYPMVADSRAALTALLWRKGCYGEAESNWASVLGLDPRYKDHDWLRNVRRWPPKPSSDLMAFLNLEKP